MSIGRYKIDRFYGIDQSVEECFLANGYTGDACNMCTDDGNLSVAKGFKRFVLRPVPDEDTVYRTCVFRKNGVNIYLAFAGRSVYMSYGGAWLLMYTFKKELEKNDFAFLEAKIGSDDYLIIGTGETQLLKFDGENFSDFGSENLCSNRPVRYMAMYKNRLFCAGDADFPNRLYWSKLPGDSRSIEDWGSDEASVNVEGGHTEIGMFDSDPIVAICALSSQLLIFKKNSLYRLYGDKPSNFTVERVESEMLKCAHTSIVHYGDAAYFLTKAGIYVFDGVSAHPLSDSLCIKDIMKNADVAESKGVKTREKLYFTIKLSGEDALLEYNLNRCTYMIRKGFIATDLFELENDVFITSNRYICKLGEGDTYDGLPIDAYWNTPLTDLNEKSVIKQLKELFLRGGESVASIRLETDVGGIKREYTIRLTDSDVNEIPLCDEGRTFKMRLFNEAGGFFSIKGGLELHIGLRGRCV